MAQRVRESTTRSTAGYVSNFTTPSHSRQTSNDYHNRNISTDVSTPLYQTSLLARLNEEYNPEQDILTEDSQSTHNYAIRTQVSQQPKHSRTVSDLVISSRYHSEVPAELRQASNSVTVQYENNYKTVNIVNRPAEEIINESIRENCFNNYSNNFEFPTSVVSNERRNASAHLNLAESNITTTAAADLQAENFLRIPIIRENTYENPWDYAKFLERRTHLVRTDSDHTQFVKVTSEVDLNESRIIIQARYFSKHLLDLLGITDDQVGKTTHIRLLEQQSSARNLHYLLYLGGHAGISTDFQNAAAHVSSQSLYLNSSVAATGYQQSSNERYEVRSEYDEVAETIPITTYQPVTLEREDSHAVSYQQSTYNGYNEVRSDYHEVPETIPITSYQPVQVEREHVETSTANSGYQHRSHTSYEVRSQYHEVPETIPITSYQPVHVEREHVETAASNLGYQHRSHTSYEVRSEYHEVPETIPITSYQPVTLERETVQTSASNYGYQHRANESYEVRSEYHEVPETIPITSYQPIYEEIEHVETAASNLGYQHRSHTSYEVRSEYHEVPETIPITSYQPVTLERETVQTSASNYGYQHRANESYEVRSEYHEVPETIPITSYQPIYEEIEHVETAASNYGYQHRSNASYEVRSEYHEVPETIPITSYQPLEREIIQTSTSNIGYQHRADESYEIRSQYQEVPETIPIRAYSPVNFQREEPIQSAAVSSSETYVMSSTYDQQNHNRYSEIRSDYQEVSAPVETYQAANTSVTLTRTYSEIDRELEEIMTKISFPLHKTVYTEERQVTQHVEEPPVVLRPVIEETTVLTTVNESNVHHLREQLLTCEERLKQKEISEAARRQELEYQAEQNRIRCEELERRVADLSQKLNQCEARCLQKASQHNVVDQKILEERNRREYSEVQARELRAKLSECEQMLVKERSLQSVNQKQMKERADFEQSALRENEDCIRTLNSKLAEYERRLEQQQSEQDRYQREDHKLRQVIGSREQEINTLRLQLNNCEARVQQGTVDMTASKALEAELSQQRSRLLRMESDLQQKIQQHRAHEEQEKARRISEQTQLQAEREKYAMAKIEFDRKQNEQYRTIQEERQLFEREKEQLDILLKTKSSEINNQSEEIRLLKKQLEESKQKERIYDEVHETKTDSQEGSPRFRKGNLQYETFEKTTVIQRSTKEYTVDENDYEEIDQYRKNEHIYAEPRSATINKVTVAEADSTSNRHRHLIDVSLPLSPSITVGVNVGKSEDNKFEKNIYADVPTEEFTSEKVVGLSSSKIINMSKRNNWEETETAIQRPSPVAWDNEVSSTTVQTSAIPHVKSVPEPLRIISPSIGEGVNIIDERGQKHLAVKVDHSPRSPREDFSPKGIVERNRQLFEQAVRDNVPVYSTLEKSHNVEKNVNHNNNVVTSSEEIITKEVTVLENVSSPSYTIETRPHVSDLRKEFEIGRGAQPSYTTKAPEQVPPPTPSTPSSDAAKRRPVNRLVDTYVTTEVTNYSSSGVLPSKSEQIYDNVFEKEEPIYDTIADNLSKEEEPIQRSWAVNTNTSNVRFDNHRSTMTDAEYKPMNGHIPNNVEKFSGEESRVLHEWDPRPLVHELYSVSYEPRVETKKTRFINIEGHVNVPSQETKTIAELERDWKQQYMRTKEGRLQVFISHCAEEAPVNDHVLSGCDIEVNREERTLRIHGGPKKLNIIIQVPSNVFDKWRQSLSSHAVSSQTDAYVKPIPRSLPRIDKHVVIIELGSCSIRAGLFNQDPSLPQSFFPAIAVRTEDGNLVVGADAYAPEVRHRGEFICPIQAHNPSLERYTLHKDVVVACLRKVISDLAVDPSRHQVLLSIPQNIPNALIGELVTIALNDIGFKGSAITRQPSLILYAYGVETGVVVDIGDRLNIVPIFDGYVVESAICSIPYGATQVRESLRSNLCSNNKGLYSFQSPVEKLILRYVLEQTAYVAENFAEEERANHSEVNVSLEPYNLPPGATNTFNIDGSRFTCTEGFFNPKRWGLESKPLHQLVHDAVSLSPIDSRRSLMKNIFLAGGATLLPGLAERLEQELTAIPTNNLDTQVHISPWRYNAAYLGAYKLAEKPIFEDLCIKPTNLGKFLSELSTPRS